MKQLASIAATAIALSITGITLTAHSITGLARDNSTAQVLSQDSWNQQSNFSKEVRKVFFNGQMIKAHNEYRAQHPGTPSLTKDKALVKHAQAHADYLVQLGTLRHSNTVYGENVYWNSATTIASSGDSEAEVAKAWARAAAKAWYSEIKDYDFATGTAKTPGAVIGHFTQMVWKNTTQIGCGIAMGDSGTYMVCNYAPPGNFLGQYTANVSASRGDLDVLE